MSLCVYRLGEWLRRHVLCVCGVADGLLDPDLSQGWWSGCRSALGFSEDRCIVSDVLGPELDVFCIDGRCSGRLGGHGCNE